MFKRIALASIALLFAFALSTVRTQAQGGWDYLGDAHVDGANDHDSIHVGKHDGRFRAIQLRVEGAEVFFERVIVHFHDGSHEELLIRDRIPAGGQTRAIDLPGERRVIESVELWYSKARWEHRPKVALFGLR
jgi:hypothetical protein